MSSHGIEALRRMWKGRYDIPVGDVVRRRPDGTVIMGPVVVDLGDLAAAYTELVIPADVEDAIEEADKKSITKQETE